MGENAFMARITERLQRSPRYPGLEERDAASQAGGLPAGAVEEDAFWVRVGEEMKRSDRHAHPFTILVLRQQSTEGSLRSLGSSLLDVVDPRLVRETDLITFFAREFAIGMLLPETRMPEAVALVERMQEIRRERRSYVAAVMEYPVDTEKIRALRERTASPAGR